MENKSFTYNYSAARNKEVESIRRKYVSGEESKLESLCFGIIGALIFGIGMCFFLGVFAGMAWLTAILMICGMLLMISAYPLYRHIAKRVKAELTPEILRLSDEIMK